ncbi:hypothetical protein VNO77_05047 [Canavalia gladiata]|uniref:Uncharacterized protein n=1 Tax=Canavalia gladiata TaxID=3824 RepID=A0AAN9MY82_CANGL
MNSRISLGLSGSGGLLAYWVGKPRNYNNGTSADQQTKKFSNGANADQVAGWFTGLANQRITAVVLMQIRGLSQFDEDQVCVVTVQEFWETLVYLYSYFDSFPSSDPYPILVLPFDQEAETRWTTTYILLTQVVSRRVCSQKPAMPNNLATDTPPVSSWEEGYDSIEPEVCRIEASGLILANSLKVSILPIKISLFPSQKNPLSYSSNCQDKPSILPNQPREPKRVQKKVLQN